jgi:hypothetical protein
MMTIDSDYVTYRLEEAGKTLLLAKSSSGYNLPVRPDYSGCVITYAIQQSGWIGDGGLKIAIDPDKLTRMNEALSWIGVIPLERYAIRRIVGARLLIDPATDKHLFTWSRIARALGADRKSVQRWYRQGVNMIVESLQVASDLSRQNGAGSIYTAMVDNEKRRIAA